MMKRLLISGFVLLSAATIQAKTNLGVDMFKANVGYIESEYADVTNASFGFNYSLISADFEADYSTGLDIEWELERISLSNEIPSEYFNGDQLQLKTALCLYNTNLSGMNTYVKAGGGFWVGDADNSIHGILEGVVGFEMELSDDWFCNFEVSYAHYEDSNDNDLSYDLNAYYWANHEILLGLNANYSDDLAEFGYGVSLGIAY